MIRIYDADQLIHSITLIDSQTLHHSSCATCSAVGNGFDPMGTFTSFVTVVPSSRIATVSSRVQPLRRGIHTVHTYQYRTPNKRLYIN
jgi:hypothetical protein